MENFIFCAVIVAKFSISDVFWGVLALKTAIMES